MAGVDFAKLREKAKQLAASKSATAAESCSTATVLVLDNLTHTELSVPGNQAEVERLEALELAETEINFDSLFEPKPITPTAAKPMPKPAAGFTAVYGSILQETLKALLFQVKQLDEDTEQYVTKQWWIPLSQVSYIRKSRYDIQFRDCIHVKQWVLDKNNYKPNSYTTE